MANSVVPDQTAPIGAVCSGSMLFDSTLWSSVEKNVLFNDDREVITIVLVFTYRPIIIKKQ